MMSKEATARSAISAERAMKLALEALEVDPFEMVEDADGHMVFLTNKAITALREALTNEALDKMAENAKELGLDYEPAQQEPVAWMFQHGETERTLCVDALQVKWGFEGRNPSYQKIAPLYISPPAQRTWVGLTDEEKSDIWCVVTNRDFVTEDTHVYADAIEAKLKEKNT